MALLTVPCLRATDTALDLRVQKISANKNILNAKTSDLMMKHKLMTIVALLTIIPSLACVQTLNGKTFWTLFDSLGDTNHWQPLLAKLTGMTFIDSLNYHIMS